MLRMKLIKRTKLGKNSIITVKHRFWILKKTRIFLGMQVVVFPNGKELRLPEKEWYELPRYDKVGYGLLRNMLENWDKESER